MAALRAAPSAGRSPEWKIRAVSNRALIKQSQNPESVHAAIRRERSGGSAAGARPFTKVVVQAAVQDSSGAQNIKVSAQSHITGSPTSAPNPAGWPVGTDCIFIANENSAGMETSAPSTVTPFEKPSQRIS